MTVIRSGESVYLVDCGLFYPEIGVSRDERKKDADCRNALLPVDSRDVSAVLLTHAHLDHIGRLPLLIEKGYRHPIYCTDATAKISKVMLAMSVKIDDSRARNWTFSSYPGPTVKLHYRADCDASDKILRRSRHVFHGKLSAAKGHILEKWPNIFGVDGAAAADEHERMSRISVCKKCAELEVDEIMTLFSIVDHEAFALADNIHVRFQPAGHIPGASSIVMDIDTGALHRRVVFSGDLGNTMSPLYDPPVDCPRADYVFLECTYGPTVRPFDPESERNEFRQALSESIHRGEVVLIPAFALDRTQKILYEIVLAQREGLLSRNLPILHRSPTAQIITELYRAHQREWLKPTVADDSEAFRPPGMTEKAKDVRENAHIVLDTSGMLDAAYSQEEYEKIKGNNDATVFLVGYQAGDSTGRKLKDATPDQTANAGPKVKEYRCFSGHGDSADIDKWLSNVSYSSTLVLVHGDDDAIHGRQDQLKKHGWQEVKIADVGTAIIIE